MMAFLTITALVIYPCKKWGLFTQLNWPSLKKFWMYFAVLNWMINLGVLLSQFSADRGRHPNESVQYGGPRSPEADTLPAGGR